MEIINDFNLKKQADELGVSIWKTPSFLFILVGIINITAMTATYFVSRKYDNPEMLVLSESITTILILLIGNLIIKGVEQFASVNRAKTEFIAVASHQLRTPLSAIKWEIEVLNSKFGKGLTKKQAESIENIDGMTRRMDKIVSELLDVAKIDQKKLTLKKEKFDLMSVVSDVKINLAVLLKVNGITLTIKLKNSKKEVMVMGDLEKIREVIENLLSNSIKYSRKHGKIEILVKKDQNFWVFSIKDNGVGIPKNQHRQVFSKFFRSYNVSRCRAEGTGLGLYIVKNIVEKSGGRIWFKSEENIGSVFNFSLPMA